MKNVIESMGKSFRTEKGLCEIHGDFEAPVMKHQSGEPDCPSCGQLQIQKVRESQMQDQIAQHRSAQQRARIASIGIPRRLAEKTFEHYRPQTNAAGRHVEVCQGFAENWVATAGQGANLVLCGKPGTGKTHLAAVICRQVAAENNAQPIYSTASQMLRYIRAAYSPNAPYSEAQAMDRFIDADLLVIDEIGAKLPSEHDRSMLFEIVDERYQLRSPTIIISNLTVDEISKQTDARMVDRLSENGSLLIFDWESYRGNAGVGQ